MNKISKIEIAPTPLKIGYARVSTDDQRLDLQTDALTKFGVLLDHLHVEKISAVKRRPILDLAIKDLEPGDYFVVWRLDRLARNMPELLKRIEEIEKAGATLISLTENFDTKSATGKLMLHMIGAFAAFERDVIRERTMAGMASRKARGFEIGRPLVMTSDKIAKAKTMLETTPAPMVAKAIGVSVASIYAHFTVKTVKGKRIIKRKPQK